MPPIGRRHQPLRGRHRAAAARRTRRAAARARATRRDRALGARHLRRAALLLVALGRVPPAAAGPRPSPTRASRRGSRCATACTSSRWTSSASARRVERPRRAWADPSTARARVARCRRARGQGHRGDGRDGGDRRQPQRYIVNTTNNGAIPNLPDDAIVEVPALVDRSGVHPGRRCPRAGPRRAPEPPLGRPADDGPGRAARRPRACAAGVAAGSPGPEDADVEGVDLLLDEMLAANAAMLPQFARRARGREGRRRQGTCVSSSPILVRVMHQCAAPGLRR